jgi:hypothetical protein
MPSSGVEAKLGKSPTCSLVDGADASEHAGVRLMSGAGRNRIRTPRPFSLDCARGDERGWDPVYRGPMGLTRTRST